MGFLNPTDQSFSAAWSLSFKGTAVNAFMLVVFGAVLAVLTSLLPYPITAVRQMKESATTMRKTLKQLKADLVNYYAGDKETMEIELLQAQVGTIKDKIADTRTAIG